MTTLTWMIPGLTGRGWTRTWVRTGATCRWVTVSASCARAPCSCAAPLWQGLTHVLFTSWQFIIFEVFSEIIQVRASHE